MGEEAGGRLKEPPRRRGDGDGSTAWSEGKGVPDQAATTSDSRQRGGRGEKEEEEEEYTKGEGGGDEEEEQKEGEEEEEARDGMEVEDRGLHAHDGGVTQKVLKKSAEGGSQGDQFLNYEALGTPKALDEIEDGDAARGFLEEPRTSSPTQANKRSTDGRARPESRPVPAERIPTASAVGLGGAGRDKEVERTGFVENGIISGGRIDSKEDEAERRKHVREERRFGDEAEVVWVQGVKAHVNASREEDDAASNVDVGALREHIGGNTDGDALGASYADDEVPPALGDLRNGHGDGGEGHPRRDAGDDHQPALEWQPRKGDLVEVERRMTPGVNKPGGTARVVKVDAAAGTVDVRYVVEGGWERGIDMVYVSLAVLDLNEKRPTLGRCRHCGSLRVDCRQGCEFYTTPRSPRLLPRPPSSDHVHVLPDRSRCAAAHRSESGRGSQRSKDRRRGSGRLRHRSHASDRGKVDEHRHQSKRRRRHLPEKWDEEGEPVPGDGEAVDGGGDSNGAPVEGGRRSQTGSPRRSTGATSSGSSSSTDDIISAGDRKSSISSKKRRVRWPESESGSGSDSDLAFLGDRTIHRSAASRRGAAGFSSSGGSGGSSDSSSVSARSHRPNGIGSDDSSVDDSEGDPGKEEGYRSPNGRVRGRPWLGDAVDSVKAGTALFLVPEGEEAARMLPSDIPDPTRGVTDPVVLRKEFDLLLQRIAERDTNKLEQDVAGVCR